MSQLLLFVIVMETLMERLLYDCLLSQEPTVGVIDVKCIENYEDFIKVICHLSVKIVTL